jgi:hypothetical protein
MKLVLNVPRIREHPQLHVFVCPSCGDVETKEVPGTVSL